MNALRSTLLLSCVLALLTGCASVNGHWTVDKVTPEAGGTQFQYGAMCLKDGHFVARLDCSGNYKLVNGTYTYNPLSKELNLRPQTASARTYKAQPIAGGRQLKIWNLNPRQTWTAFMNQETCPSGQNGQEMCCAPHVRLARCKLQWEPASYSAPARNTRTGTGKQQPGMNKVNTNNPNAGVQSGWRKPIGVQNQHPNTNKPTGDGNSVPITPARITTPGTKAHVKPTNTPQPTNTHGGR
ncbi:MAG: hypothetical protein AB1716_15475 [Planctomycetota bacterium]